MKYTAKIQAIDPITRKLKTYCDVIEIPVDNIDAANKWCQKNYKGYMHIDGFWVCDIEVDDKVLKYHQEKCQCESGGYMDGICFNCGLPIK